MKSPTMSKEIMLTPRVFEGMRVRARKDKKKTQSHLSDDTSRAVLNTQVNKNPRHIMHT